MLPLHGEYYDATGLQTGGVDSWLGLLLRLRDLLACPNEDGKPGWAGTSGHIGVFLVLPSTSEMSRKWGGSVDGTGAFNYTGLNLVETS